MTRRKEPPPEAPADPVAPDPAEPAANPAETTVADMATHDTPPPDAPPVAPLHAAASVASPELPPARRGGIFAPLLGGALAAVGGFLLSHYDLLRLAPPDTTSELAAKVEAATARLAAAEDKTANDIAALTARVSALEAAPAPAGPDLSRLDAVEERLTALETAPAGTTGGDAALTGRLAALERRLAEQPAASPSPEIQAQLDAAFARLDAAEAEAKSRAQAAETAAETARRGRLLDALASAVDAGGPFAAELQALDDPALTSSLGAMADSGVPTLSSLQGDFPEAAREALRIARSTNSDAGWTARVLDFLAAQTEARPLTPQEGSTPDAILSRAEFALSEARVADALAELAALEPAVRAPFDDWTKAATAHVEATTAIQSALGKARGE